MPQRANPLNPVVTALQRAFAVCMEGTSQVLNSRIGVFSHSDDFTGLWELDASLKPRAVSSGDFLIVVDDGRDRRSDVPEADKHLTAIDWVALFAVVFLKSKSTLTDSSTNQSELDRIEPWCEMATQDSETATRENAHYIDAVTLIPRLIACVDYSLSIILFSSINRLLVAHRCLARGDIPRAIDTGTSIAMSLEWNQMSTAVNSIAEALQAAAESMSSPKISVLQQPKLNQIEERLTGVVSNISSVAVSATINSLEKSFTAGERNCKASLKMGDVVEFTLRRDSESVRSLR